MPGLKLLDRSLVREPHFSGLDCQAATKPVEQCLAKIRNASLGLISNVKKTYSSTRCFPKTHSAIRGFHRAFHISVIFCGISMVCTFAAIIIPSRTVLDRSQMRDLRTSSLLAAAAMSCLFGVLAWKFHRTDRTLSLAWLANVGMLCAVAITASFLCDRVQSLTLSLD